MSAISPVVTCSTIYEYQTPDGRIQPLIYTRLATTEERDRIIQNERGNLDRERHIQSTPQESK